MASEKAEEGEKTNVGVGGGAKVSKRPPPHFY